MKLTLLIIVALLCACIPARAGTKEPWLNDPAILFSTRITVAVAFVLDAHEIVVSDDQRRLWLLILRDGKPEGRFFYSQVLGLQASFCDNGAVYYIIVPPLGYKWQIPLKKHQTLGAISDLRHLEERSASLPFRTLKRLPAQSALALNRFYEPSRHNGRNSSDSFWASTVGSVATLDRNACGKSALRGWQDRTAAGALPWRDQRQSARKLVSND